MYVCDNTSLYQIKEGNEYLIKERKTGCVVWRSEKRTQGLHLVDSAPHIVTATPPQIEPKQPRK